MHVIAGKAVCFGEALSPEFKRYGRAILDNTQRPCRNIAQAEGCD